jgi:hypothetical protein
MLALRPGMIASEMQFELLHPNVIPSQLGKGTVLQWGGKFFPLESYRFSAFWLRSKCSICSYQLNIWYSPHWGLSILNWFLNLDRVFWCLHHLCRGLACYCSTGRIRPTPLQGRKKQPKIRLSYDSSKEINPNTVWYPDYDCATLDTAQCTTTVHTYMLSGITSSVPGWPAIEVLAGFGPLPFWKKPNFKTSILWLLQGD